MDLGVREVHQALSIPAHPTISRIREPYALTQGQGSLDWL